MIRRNKAAPGTVLAVVHDRYFISRFATSVWVLEDARLRRYVDLDDVRRGQAAMDQAGTDAAGKAS